MSDPETDEENPSGPGGEGEARRREPVFNLPGVVMALVAVCVGVQLLIAFVLDERQALELMTRAAFIPERYSGAYLIDIYAFTSPVTYSFLHGSWVHLAVNMIWLAAFGSPLANRTGWARFLAFWVATALAAALLHYVTHIDGMAPVVGASGAISGMMGAASRFGFAIARGRDGRAAFAGPVLSIAETLRSRSVLAFLGVWFAVNLASGLGFGEAEIGGPIAWEAHIGGFLAGFFALPLFLRGR